MKTTNNMTPLTKQEQCDLIQKVNPPKGFMTWVRTVEDVMTYEEANEGIDSDPCCDFSFEEMQKAMRSGFITVYSSHPIKNGIFVTPSALEAASYSGDGFIRCARVRLTDIAWIDETQGQIATNRQIRCRRISCRGWI